MGERFSRSRRGSGRCEARVPHAGCAGTPQLACMRPFVPSPMRITRAKTVHSSRRLRWWQVGTFCFDPSCTKADGVAASSASIQSVSHTPHLPSHAVVSLLCMLRHVADRASQVRTSCSHEANELMPDESTCSADCLQALRTCGRLSTPRTATPATAWPSLWRSMLSWLCTQLQPLVIL